MFYSVHFLFLISILLVSKTKDKVQGNTAESHWGTFFVFSFLENESGSDYMVVVTARETSSVKITFHETGTTKQVTLSAKTSYKHTFPKTAAAVPAMEVLPRKAVSVESNVKVSVYGFGFKSSSAEGFLALPVESLGTQYLAITLENTKASTSGNSQIVIAAITNNTRVAIEVQTADVNNCFLNSQWSNNTHAGGYVFSINMAAYDVVNVQCFRDLTGSMVISTTSVAVISGGRCLVLDDATTFDYFVEMLPPTAEFGSQFIIKTQANFDKAALRILALEDNTQFSGISGNPKLQARQFMTISPRNYFCFASTQPVLVALFQTGPDPTQKFGFMMLIPPTNKYTKEHVLDGSPLSTSHSTSTQFHHTYDAFFSFQTGSLSQNIPNGCPEYIYDIYSFTNVRKFSQPSSYIIFFYGFDANVAYGFPAGMKISTFTDTGATLPYFAALPIAVPVVGSTSIMDIVTSDIGDVTTAQPEMTSQDLSESSIVLSTFSSFSSFYSPPISDSSNTLNSSSDILSDSLITSIDSWTLSVDGSTFSMGGSDMTNDDSFKSIEYSTLSADNSTLLADSSTLRADSSTLLADSSTIFIDSSPISTDNSTNLIDRSNLLEITATQSVDSSFKIIYSSTIQYGKSNSELDEVTSLPDSSVSTTDNTSPVTEPIDGMNSTSGSTPETGNYVTSSIAMTTYENTHVTSQSSTSSHVTSEVTTTTSFSKIDFRTIPPIVKTSRQKVCNGYLCQCACPCNESRLNKTLMSTLAKTHGVALKLIASKLSKARRLKMSAHNIQRSEVNLGISSVLFLVSAASTIVLLDLLRCQRSDPRRQLDVVDDTN